MINIRYTKETLQRLHTEYAPSSYIPFLSSLVSLLLPLLLSSSSPYTLTLHSSTLSLSLPLLLSPTLSLSYAPLSPLPLPISPSSYLPLSPSPPLPLSPSPPLPLSPSLSPAKFGNVVPRQPRTSSRNWAESKG